ncbi:MAG TPA: putative zinc-binding peptidase [Pirellulales bacterium]
MAAAYEPPTATFGVSMKIFHCDHCDNLLFFENVLCVKCQHALAYVPDLADIQSLEAAGENLWKPARRKGESRTYRLCANYVNHNVCNWAVPSDDPNPLCESCRLTRVIPDLNRSGNQEAWYRLEVAKRRLVYTLMYLKLPILNREDDPKHGLAFEFLADVVPPADGKAATPSQPTKPILTGHSDGVITINVAEADDAEREKRRMQLHEPYRTLLGHFRHEVGHYYWDRLIKDSDRLEPFRGLFGDDQIDYGQALEAHYAKGAPADWQQHFVSSYASSHPWEDWAETWAHYLHMVDTLETAANCGLSLRPVRKDEPTLKKAPEPRPEKYGSFDTMIDNWFPLTYVLNNLNRGLGLSDGYPFVLSTPVIEKLRFVHETIADGIQQQAGAAAV